MSQGLWVLASGSGEASVTAGGVRCLQRHVQGPGLQGKSHPQGSQSLSEGLSQQGQCHLLGQPPRRAAHTHLPPERGDSPQILDLSYTGVTPQPVPLAQRGTELAGAGVESPPPSPSCLCPHEHGFLQGRLWLLTLAPAPRYFGEASGLARPVVAWESPPSHPVQVPCDQTGETGRSSGPGEGPGLLGDKDLGLRVRIGTR